MALTALKADRLAPDSNTSNMAADKALEDMEAEADNTVHAGNGEVCKVSYGIDANGWRYKVSVGAILLCRLLFLLLVPFRSLFGSSGAALSCVPGGPSWMLR